MKPDTPTINEAYVAYADLLLKHIRLLSDSKDESAEIEQVEEAMSRLWEKLDEAQRRSLKGIGSDLNWVRRRGELPPRGRASEEVSQKNQADLKAAQIAEDWHAVLYHLRTCAAVMPSERLAAIRAQCYREIGLESVASAFHDFAADLRAACAENVAIDR
jgi:hypothetical protein